MHLKRIAVTGPESTGKSELAKNLALQFNTVWVPEVARDYLEGLGRTYEFGDIGIIARKQYELENRLAKRASGILICDTDFLVTKIWSIYKYGKCDPWIEVMVKNHGYDLYLLCDIDLPWVEDPLREHPARRNELFNLYLDELKKNHARFEIISGTGRDRTENAILAVERAFGLE